MAPRPFPFAMSIGTDIVFIPRIRRILERSRESKRSTRFLRRLLTLREQEMFRERMGLHSIDSQHGLNLATEYLAGRWAAKEAVIKAVQRRRLGFLDIEIRRQESLDRPKAAVYALILDNKEPSKPYSVRRVSWESSGDDDSTTFDSPRSVTEDPQDLTEEVSGWYHGHDHEPNGLVPEAELTGQVAKISISHDGDYATAVCLAVDDPMEGDVGGEAAARMP